MYIAGHIEFKFSTKINAISITITHTIPTAVWLVANANSAKIIKISGSIAFKTVRIPIFALYSWY